MGKTFNRRPISVRTPSSNDMKNYFFSHYNWKGINENQNFLAVDQETFADTKNVFINEFGLLQSRRPIRPIDLPYEILDMWAFGKIVIYLTMADSEEYSRKLLIDDSGVQTEVNLKSEKIVIKDMDNKLVMFSIFENGEEAADYIRYYDIVTKQVYIANGDNLLYIPISAGEGTSSEIEVEPENVLYDAVRKTYLYNYNTALDAGIIGNTVKYTLETPISKNDITINAVGANLKDVILNYKTSLSKDNLVNDKLFFAVSNLGSMAVLYPDLRSVYYAPDGVNFTESYTIPLEADWSSYEYKSIEFSRSGKQLLVGVTYNSGNYEYFTSFIVSVVQDVVIDDEADFKYPTFTRIPTWTYPDGTVRQYYFSSTYNDSYFLSDFIDISKFVLAKYVVNDDKISALAIGVNGYRLSGGDAVSIPRYLMNDVGGYLYYINSFHYLFANSGYVGYNQDGGYNNDDDAVVWCCEFSNDRYSKVLGLFYWRNIYNFQYMAWPKSSEHMRLAVDYDRVISRSSKDFQPYGKKSDEHAICFSDKNHKLQILFFGGIDVSDAIVYSTNVICNDNTNAQVCTYQDGQNVIISNCYINDKFYEAVLYNYVTNTFTEFVLPSYPGSVVGINGRGSNDIAKMPFGEENRIPLLSNVFDDTIELNYLEGGNINPIAKDFDKIVTLNEHYFTKDNELYISDYREENDEFRLYVPKISKQNFDTKIYNLHPISDNLMGVFTETGIWYVENTDLGYKYTQSKLRLYIDENIEVTTARDGVATLLCDKNGLLSLSYQNFIASTEQSLSYLSDVISSRFNGGKKYKLTVYKYWVLCYDGETSDVYLFDIRNGSWWYFDLNTPIQKIIVLVNDEFDYELGILSNGKLYKFENVKDVDYFDNIDNDKIRIDWFIESQKLHLNAPNYHKHIINLTLASTETSENPIHLDLQVKNYRKQVNEGLAEIFDYRVDVIRTFVKRLNYAKLCEFQYRLASDDEDQAPTQLSLSSIIIKYKIGGQVR